MKMTRQEIADLLLNINDDCSNLELQSDYLNEDGIKFPKWIDIPKIKIEQLFYYIYTGNIYRIKDNSIKEITFELFDRLVVSKDGRQKGRISSVHLGNEHWDPHVTIGGNDYCLEQLSNTWQLVED